MIHPKDPKRPDLNQETAPMWALWHYHMRDLHHGMHDPNPMAPTHQKPEDPVPEECIRVSGPAPLQRVKTEPIEKGPVEQPLQESSVPKAEDKTSALTRLEEKLRHFREPSIAQTAKNMVFADGNPHSAIMLIGEAPGAEEDLQGKPFVGASGKLLDAMMASIQLDRSKVYITNVVPWRPPFNRQPSSAEIKTFLPFLQEHIHLIQPRLLICVGAVAAKAVLNLDQTLTQSQGQVLWYTNPLSHEKIPTWTLYHPAYLMRAPGQKRAAWQQLLCIQGFLKEKGITP